jgi:hypothetical protein
MEKLKILIRDTFLSPENFSKISLGARVPAPAQPTDLGTGATPHTLVRLPQD